MSANTNQVSVESIRIGLHESGYTRLGREWNYKRLSSPFSRIYLIEEGEAVIRHSGQIHHLKAGTLHLVPCHVTADYSCPESHTQYFAGFTMKLESGSDLFAVRRCDPTLPATENHVSIFRRICELIQPMTGRFGRLSNVQLPLAHAVEIRGLVMQLAAAFLETVHEPTDAELELEGRFTPILQFIDENLRRDIALETLAELAGLTPSYFSDLFHNTLGVRPVEFINRRRIERAQLMLASSDRNIQEIADAVGINSATYFSRLFHRVTGMSPSRYRRLLLGL